MFQMTPTTLTGNGQRHTVTALPDTPLLWVLRERLKLTRAEWVKRALAEAGSPPA